MAHRSAHTPHPIEYPAAYGNRQVVRTSRMTTVTVRVRHPARGGAERGRWVECLLWLPIWCWVRHGYLSVLDQMQHFEVLMRVTSVRGDAEVYEKHRDELTRFARVLVGRDDAPDVVSNVVTRVLASGRSLAGLREPRSYLMKAVLNESRSVIRKRRVSSAAIQPHYDRLVDYRIGEAVAGLPPRQRAVTFLAYWGEMTSSEIAELLGMRSGTVRRYLHLAREKLRGVLDANQ